MVIKITDHAAAHQGLGPKMLELTDRQQAFVLAMIETGGNKTRSAINAGFGGENYNAAASYGHKLARDPKIIAAMQELAEQWLMAGAIKAAGTLIELLDNPDPKVRFKASVEALNRAGLQVETKHMIKIEHTDKTTTELLDFIKTAAIEQNLDPRLLLGQAGIDPTILDAEYTEVTADSPAVEPASTLEGLEDLV